MATTALGRTQEVTTVAVGSPLARVVMVAAPLVLAAATLLALLVFLTPPLPSDQLNYLDAARDFPSVPANPAIVHQYARTGLVLPMALAVGVFGYSQAAYYVVPVLAAVALVLGVYALGSLLFSRAVAVGAAILAVGNTAIFVDATAPLPDLLATTLFLWAVVVAVGIRQGLPLLTRTPARRRLGLLALGGLLGWSYLAREFIVFVWPLIPLLLFRKVTVRELIWIAIPLGLIGLTELALNAWVFGDPLARVRVASEHGSGPVPEELAATYQNKRRIWYLAQLGVAISAVPEGAWLLGLLGAAVVGGLVWPRRLGLFLVWIALLYVPLVLLGGVLNPDAPMLRLFKVRYWYPLFPAFIVGGVAAVWLLARWVATLVRPTAAHAGLIAAAVAAGLALAPVAVAHAARDDSPAHRAGGATEMELFRDWLSAHHDEVAVLWADSRTVRVARVFTSGPLGGSIWDGQFHILEPPDGATDPQPGDHVLLYSAHADVCGFCRVWSERIFGAPVSVPDGWREAFATDDGMVRVYEVP